MVSTYKIPRAHSEVTRIAPALPGRIAALIALSVPISVVLIATPPEETRDWADADKVVPNAVPPEEADSRLSGCLSAVINLKTARALGLELAPTLVALAHEVIKQDCRLVAARESKLARTGGSPQRSDASAMGRTRHWAAKANAAALDPLRTSL